MLCRFSADDKPTTVPNARALPQKPPEARETIAPKPSAHDVVSERTKQQPPDSQSSAQIALSGVPTHYTLYYTGIRALIRVLVLYTTVQSLKFNFRDL